MNTDSWFYFGYDSHYPPRPTQNVPNSALFISVGPWGYVNKPMVTMEPGKTPVPGRVLPATSTYMGDNIGCFHRVG